MTTKTTTMMMKVLVYLSDICIPKHVVYKNTHYNVCVCVCVHKFKFIHILRWMRGSFLVSVEREILSHWMMMRKPQWYSIRSARDC